MANTSTDSFASSLERAVVAGALSLFACTTHDDVTSLPVATERSAEVFPDHDCVANAAGEGWKNGFIPQQTGRFITRIALAPFDAPIDALVGLSNGRADSFTDLAAIIRLNPAGFIDVRNGSTYMADIQYPYHAGRRVGFRLDVDLPNHVYDVWVYPWDLDDERVLLARSYRFRTEQSTVSRLDNAARIVDSPQGSFEACYFSTGLSSGSCRRTPAGSGWLSESFPAQSTRFRVQYLARAMEPAMDVVFGLSNGPPIGFSSLAAALRFNDQGTLDVRDGDVYRADAAVPYSAAENFEVIMDVDVANHTYSVLVGGFQPGDFVLLAANYRFRTEQASITSLDHFGQFVDSSSGEGHACFLTIDYP